MKVILLEDVKNLGKGGDAVNVADGFGRNFLLPRKLAVGATPQNQKIFDNEAKARAKKRSKEHAESVALSEKIGALSLTISRVAGEDDKLFGSVTNADVAEALEKEGIKVDKRHIVLAEPLKTLGNHEVTVRLGHEVTATAKVSVVKQ
ncbi:MAG: 50S ribosomal protein L9 [candidate division FCPU426 bacterium]